MKKATKAAKAKKFACNCGETFASARRLKAHLTENVEHSAKS